MQTVLLSFVWAFWGFLAISPQVPNGAQRCEVPSPLKKIHPFHVSVTEVNHNLQDATLELQGKLFTDDFEAALSKLYKRKVDLIEKSLHESMDSLVSRYFLSHLQIKVNGKLMSPSYLGFEQEKEAVYVFVEYSKIPANIQEVEFFNNLMYDHFTDQVNILHFKSGEKRKSVKLDYPDTTIRFTL